MLPVQTAIMRQPPPTAGNGLTTAKLGRPDLRVLSAQHRRYRETLEALGIHVVLLDQAPEYPDSYFTEDVAVVVPELAVLARPGAKERRGEADLIKTELSKYRALERIVEPGTLDGGDVLIINHHCIVGVSSRTNREGANQLSEILSAQGYSVHAVNLGEGLHLKSSLNALDDETVLLTDALSSLQCLKDYRKLTVPQHEEYAANVLAINGRALVPENFSDTEKLLSSHGYEVVKLPVSEVRKMDGGLTCLSIRIT